MHDYTYVTLRQKADLKEEYDKDVYPSFLIKEV